MSPMDSASTPDGTDDAARRGGCADEGQGLDQHDDQSDTGHEPRYHDVGGVGDVTADLQHAQQNLQEPAHHDHDQGFAHGTGVIRYDDRHGHGHGRRGPGYLGTGPAEQRGEQPDADRAVQAGRRAHARGDAEGQRYRQADYRRGYPAEQITSESVQTVVQRSTPVLD